MDTQAHTADDPLYARRCAFGNVPAAAALPCLSRQTCADACQHGCRRALLPGGQRREMPPLRVVPVAIPANQQARRGVRARTRLVLRIRIPAGSGARLRRLRRPAHDGLFRNGTQEGRKHHLLGFARRNGFGQDHRRGIRRIHRPAHAQDRLHQLPGAFGAAIRHPASRRPHRSGVGLSVARGFRAPDLRIAPGHHARTGA